MSFARPELWWLAMLLPLVASGGVLGWVRRRRRVVERLGDAGLVARLGLDGAAALPVRRLMLVAGAAAALGIAVLGPRWGDAETQGQSRSFNVVLVLDVSKSMLARDVEPDRLEQARLFARRLLRELPGDRIGLVAFAGRAYVLSPLTVDHAALHLYLDALEPEIVSRGGSSLASALRQGTDLVREDADLGGARGILLVTDGEALEEEADVRAAAERAARQGVVVHTVGVGTREGAPVPERDPATGRVAGYTQHPDGSGVVVSRLGEDLLRDVAAMTGGRYTQLGTAGATDRILAGVRRLERAPSTGGPAGGPADRFYWFVALALGMLVIDAGLERWRERTLEGDADS